MALTKKSDFTFKHSAQTDEPVFATTGELKTALDSQAVELRTYINDTLTVESEALFATKDELTGVITGDIPDGSLPLAKLDTDVATQAELNTHKTSSDHDGRYYTEAEINAMVINKSILTTAGDIIYASGASSPARKGIGSPYQSLNVNSSGTSPEYQASLQSLMTTTGDLIYASGANTPARLAKGSDGQVLVLSSGVPTWENAEWTKIAETTLGSDSNKVDFNNIPHAQYSTFKIKMFGSGGGGSPDMCIRIDDDATSNYSSQFFNNNGGTFSGTYAGIANLGRVGNIGNNSSYINIVLSEIILRWYVTGSDYAINSSAITTYAGTSYFGGFSWSKTGTHPSKISVLCSSGTSYYFAGTKFELWGCK